jgi:hypothetical protein
MSDVEMIVVKNVRYRRPDAERLGLVASVGRQSSTKPKAATAAKPKKVATTK